MRARDSAQPRVNPPMPPPAIMITGPLCRKSMAAQPTWYFIQVESARYCPTMTELLEANQRSQTEQGRLDSKKQDKQMQIGVDSFAAQFADEGGSVNASASKSVRQLVERIEFADQGRFGRVRSGGTSSPGISRFCAGAHSRSGRGPDATYPASPAPS